VTVGLRRRGGIVVLRADDDARAEQSRKLRLRETGVGDPLAHRRRENEALRQHREGDEDKA